LRDLLPEEETTSVTAGLDPAIHHSSKISFKRDGPPGQARGDEYEASFVEKLVKEYRARARRPCSANCSAASRRSRRNSPRCDGIGFAIGHGESVGLSAIRLRQIDHR
jgi:peptide/nickel transport system ATP-binding protein